jgi:hypothetical protein
MLSILLVASYIRVLTWYISILETYIIQDIGHIVDYQNVNHL